MDRFIVITKWCFPRGKHHLKSSMDRFIADGNAEQEAKILDLKSSMDRFIAAEHI